MEQLTLGKLIDALSSFAPDRTVRFAFGDFDVSSVASYRGYYDELALGWREHAYNVPSKTVGELLGHLNAAVGAYFEGYKGGSFRMGRDTPMWASKWGDAADTVVVGITDKEHGCVLIETASDAAVGR